MCPPLSAVASGAQPNGRWCCHGTLWLASACIALPVDRKLVVCCKCVVVGSHRLIELITATYCWRIINRLPCMNHTARRETEYRQAVHKLITSLYSKRYRPSGMLIHRQNLFAPRSNGCREEVNKVNNTLSIFVRSILLDIFHRQRCNSYSLCYWCWLYFLLQVIGSHYIDRNVNWFLSWN
jgi:hypothetical protein